MTDPTFKKLDWFRKQIGLSQGDIAAMLSLTSQPAISKLLSGERGCYWMHMKKIRRETGVSLDYLADDDWIDDPTPEYMGMLAEVNEAVKELGPEEVLRRIVAYQPRREYRAYAPPAPVAPEPPVAVEPPPAEPYYRPLPAPQHRGPVQLGHFNVRSQLSRRASHDRPAWMDDGDDTAVPKRPIGRPKK
jgi:predicted transcriptional regulator